MKKTIFFYFSFLFLYPLSQLAQSYSDQVPSLKRYDPKDVVDSTYGITMYEKLSPLLGGDSVRYDKKGYNIQGWWDDYYKSGKLLHKGFYVDGQLRAYKNYWENGQMERIYRVTDNKHCEVFLYYPDGKIKSEVHYYNGVANKQTDFFPNGNIDLQEESHGDNDYLIKRNTFYENGNALIIFELIDKRKKIYMHKEFFEGGKIKEEGTLKFSEAKGDFVKDGEWKYYNESAKLLKTEKYQNGELRDN
jgi:antitoxin component YwqK of YwqJK toxin-antitoxin module